MCSFNHLPHPSVAGLYAGAFTTTPGLAAGQEVLRHTLGDSATSALAVTNLAYAVTYPFGIVGPMLVIVALRRLFGVQVKEELAALAATEQSRRPPRDIIDFMVTASAHTGPALRDHPLLRDKEVIIFTRLLRGNNVSVPTADTQIQLGDFYRATGPKPALAELVAALGKPAEVDFDGAHSDVRRADLLVTRTQVLRRTLRELNLIHRTGVALARITRSGVELAPRAGLTLHFGDQVTAVGPEHRTQASSRRNWATRRQTVNRPQLVPLFLGIVLGVIVGSIPADAAGIAYPHADRLGRRPAAGGHPPVPVWKHRHRRLVHAGGGQPTLPGFRIGRLSGVRRAASGPGFCAARGHHGWDVLPRLGHRDYRRAGLHRGIRRPAMGSR